MPLVRALFSRVLNRFFALGLGVPPRDLSSGFGLYRTSALDMWWSQPGTRRPPGDRGLGLDAGLAGQGDPLPLRAPGARLSSKARVLPFGRAYARTFHALWSLRNSVASADHEDWGLRQRRSSAPLSARAAVPPRRRSDLSIDKLRYARRFDRRLCRPPRDISLSTPVLSSVS
jgi:hypothetical protein